MHRGFSRGAELLFPNRYIVNLRLSDAEQRKSFLQKWRYHLNKSEKAGLSFERAPASSAMASSTRSTTAMLDRKKFADHSAYETLPALMAMPNEALRPELFFVRHLERGHRRCGDLQGRRPGGLSLRRHQGRGAAAARRLFHALAHHPLAAR